jgi:hypothetical protein
MSKGKLSKNDAKNRQKGREYTFNGQKGTPAVAVIGGKKTTIIENHAAQDWFCNDGKPVHWSNATSK